VNRGEKYKFNIQCKYCGVTFPAKRKTRRFCSVLCINRIKSARATRPELFNREHELLQTKGSKPRLGVVRKCGYCLSDVYVLPCNVSRAKVSYCSHAHAILQKKKLAKAPLCFPCKVCSQAICVPESTQRLRPRVTCSKACRRVHMRKKADARRTSYTKHQLDRLARYSPEANQWRKSVFERDNYTCQVCKQRGGYLEADHIKPWAYFPQLRFDMSNGRTLCRACHDKTKMNAKKMRRLFDEGYWG
jgi:5-methylcytosine-specific restriction endonuclease McrA